jgi:hypothetical protein
MYESRFEEIFLSQVDVLFPEYITVPFKFSVTSDEGTAKADLALIDKNYLGWWVIEVEMSRHSLNRHVLPQVRILSNAFYGDDVAQYFVNKRPNLDLEKLKSMMRGKQPRVIVVLDSPKIKWREKLEKYDAILSLFQIFRSSDDQYIFKINGQYPSDYESAKSTCYFEKILSNFLIIESPAILNILHNEKMEIIYDGAVSSWKRTDIVDKVYLIPLEFNPLNIKHKYLLVKERNDHYYLQQTK